MMHGQVELPQFQLPIGSSGIGLSGDSASRKIVITHHRWPSREIWKECTPRSMRRIGARGDEP